jgi:nucleoside-diphosphate-sugar epimerase
MKVLIFGGTGAMGTHLVRLLSENDNEIVVTSRTERKSSNNVTYVKGNARDLDYLKSLLYKEWDVIVDFMVYNTSEFEERVNLLLSSTNQYVFLSSARVYADSQKKLTEESTRLLDVSKDVDFLETDEYSLTKARQEDLLRKSNKNNWTIIRPYITYSENRLQLGVFEKEEWLHRALQGKKIVIAEEILSKMTTMTYGLDVANAINSLLGNTAAYGKTLHITTSKSIRWSKVLDIYLSEIEKHLGYRPKVQVIDLNKFLKLRPLYQIIYDRLYDRQFDNSNIREFIETETFVEPEIGLRICIRQFLHDISFKNINWKREALMDRMTQDRTRLKEIDGYKQILKYLIFRYLI